MHSWLVVSAGNAPLDAWAALVVRGSEAALLLGTYDEAFVFAVGAVIAGEGGAEVAAVGGGGDGGLRGKDRFTA